MLTGMLLAGSTIGCAWVSVHNSTQGAVAGRLNFYNYSPSVIQEGTLQRLWWCGEGANPNRPSQESDTIQYETIDTATSKSSKPATVLAETPGAWDSAFTCNPKVIGGSFSDPFGDNQNYSYAMYYVGTASPDGTDNSIGVAFSMDGIHWRKYPQPVIQSSSPVGYGVGQPAVYNNDGKQSIWLFYEDNTPAIHHVEAMSEDGVHFTVRGQLTSKGLDPDNVGASWGDMAYDYQTGYWYAAFNLPTRDPSSTGGVIERGQLGFQIYRIRNSDLMDGSWQQLATIDTNSTGHEANFLPAFLRDRYGNVNTGKYPSIQLLTSISYPATSWNAEPKELAQFASPSYWQIGTAVWDPTSPSLALKVYSNHTTHQTTTGWTDPSGGFRVQSVLGHLFAAPQNGATLPFYSCKRGDADFFVSTDKHCDGQYIVGLNGYGYAKPAPGIALVPLYSCSGSRGDYVSADARCNGDSPTGLLGYALP